MGEQRGLAPLLTVDLAPVTVELNLRESGARFPCKWSSVLEIYNERARENNYDLLYKNECQNWRNKINRVKNTAGFPADRLEKIQAAFSDFKKEALQRKKAVKTGTASPKEFTDWLYQQSNVIVELTDY